MRYMESPQFSDLAPRTRKDYTRHLVALEREFADFPLSALEDRRARGEFMAWRDRLALNSRRQADYAYSVLARVLSWSRDRGLIAINPCERGGRVYRATRKGNVWTREHENAFCHAAPENLRLALQLALWTGQRQGDLLKLTWSQYDGQIIRIRQQKTGVRVEIPVSQLLKRELDTKLEEAQTASPDSWGQKTILETSRGTTWTEGGFRASWRKACARAEISDLSFHDLRGTAVTRLAIAGCTVPEIATITGHSLKDVGSILDSHYLDRSVELGRSAITKLEAHLTDQRRANTISSS